MHLQDRKRLTGLANKVLVPQGERGAGKDEELRTNGYILLCIK